LLGRRDNVSKSLEAKKREKREREKERQRDKNVQHQGFPGGHPPEY
jgi:hypothetical protein